MFPVSASPSKMSVLSEADLVTYLKQIKCRSPMFPNADLNLFAVAKQPLVIVKKSMSFSDALEVLSKNRIHAAPVIDESNLPVAFLSVFHLIEHFFCLFSEKDFETDSFWTTIKHWYNDSQTKWKQETVDQVIASSSEDFDPFASVEEEASIYDAVKLILDCRARRVLVRHTKNQQLANVITQSRIVSILEHKIENLPLASKTIEELNLGTKSVSCVKESDKTYEAFKTILEKKISAVGILNEEGTLTGILSVSDFKYIGSEAKFWELLGTSVANYVKQVRENSDHVPEKIQSHHKPVVTLELSNTLHDTIKVLNHFKIHRVFVVDKDHKPIGVISLFDVIQALFTE